mmetsp:Transcript_73146/g.145069  ORF Transcript_73146/g.145069 Transcript_73146/m.145069 type:complete len:120 (+) Transcript_73146:55-414(+)
MAPKKTAPQCSACGGHGYAASQGSVGYALQSVGIGSLLNTVTEVPKCTYCAGTGLKQECSTCKGTGKCTGCNGAGGQENPNQSINVDTGEFRNGLPEFIQCGGCKSGSGNCSKCNGAGY